MNNASVVIQVLLIFGFGVGGLVQIFLPYTRYTKLPFQSWANDFKPWHVKLIGSLKVCAAIGMTTSLFLPSQAMIAPLAAVGIALVMAGAIATHLRRAEYPIMVGNFVYLGAALFVAYGRLVGFAV